MLSAQLGIGRLSLAAQRPGGEAAALPAVNVVSVGLADQLVAAEPGQQLGPNQPVHAAGTNDTKADDAMNVVRQVLVHVLAL